MSSIGNSEAPVTIPEKSYDEIYKDWEKRFPFGEKGEMSLHESREVHARWKRLGKLTRAGRL